jgi:hypothetical protein
MQEELRRIFKCFPAVRVVKSNAVANVHVQHVNVNFSTMYGANTTKWLAKMNNKK